MDLRPRQAINPSNTCCVCLSQKGPCGLFVVNGETKQLLSTMFNIQVDGSKVWKICVSCLKSLENAAELGVMAQQSFQFLQQLAIEKEINKKSHHVKDCTQGRNLVQVNEVNVDIQVVDDIIGELGRYEEVATVTCKTRKKKRSNMLKKQFKVEKKQKIKQLPHKDKLNRGYALKNKDGTYNCCGDKWNLEALLVHRDAKHPWLNKKLVCNNCGVQCNGKLGMLKHYREHHDGLTCTVCQRTFYHPLSVTKHMAKYHPCT